jgi:molybdopterin/thiamine biosynthesis adenylyltransferase
VFSQVFSPFYHSVTVLFRMRNSSVCLVSMTGLAAEVAKNITLAGIGSIHLVDHVVVSADDDGGANFLQSGAGASRAHASIARLSALNPNVRITAESAVITDKDAAFFAQFNVVCVFGAPLSVQIRVDELCRAAASPQRTPVFFSADALGLAAYFTADFQKHQAIITTKEEGKEEDITTVQHFDFVSTADLFNTSFAQIQKSNGRRMASISQLWISILSTKSNILVDNDVFN